MTWNSIGLESKLQKILNICNGRLESGDGWGYCFGIEEEEEDQVGTDDWGFDLAFNDCNDNGSGIADGFYFCYGDGYGDGESESR